MLDPAIKTAEVKELIEGGRASELDRQFADLMHDQLSKPDAQGILDRTFRATFRNGSSDTRALADAWLRQSPASPYAMTASGMVYVEMAQLNRGGDWGWKTSASSFASMERLLGLARDDLDRAVKIEPSLVTAYDTMIYAGGLSTGRRGGRQYARNAAERALTVDPADYGAYANLVWLEQPKWGGSVGRMQDAIAEAQKQAGKNPLMRLLLSQNSGGEAVVDSCRCGPADEVDLYRGLFAEASPSFMLDHAGYATRARGAFALSVLYRSEALRFNPGLTDVRAARGFDLIKFHQYAWALSEGDALVKLRPQEEFGYEVRGSAYRFLDDAPHARADLEQALRLHPDQSWAWVELGYLAIESEHDWNRGWEISDRLIRSWPEEPDGWILRAMVQKGQPRDGLDRTIAEFQSRFGRDPSRRALVERVKAMGHS
jgi:tetratricopeptide (TPR) repeat protein